MQKLTDTEKEFIFNNYHDKGSDFCSQHLNLPQKKIRMFANKNKLNLSPELRKIASFQNLIKANSAKQANHIYKVNPEQFLDVKTPEVAYILGFIWADGYLSRDSIKIECVKEDIEEISPVFLKTGKWITLYRDRPNRKTQMLICTNNKIITNLLRDCDYSAKSQESACKILSKIPSHLQHFWFRGVSDGDGCFYFNKKRQLRQFSLASSYLQDWTYMKNKCVELGINHSEKRRIQIRKDGKENKSSIIRFCSKESILKFGNYIYSGYEQDKIGFPRKYEKFKEIIT